MIIELAVFAQLAATCAPRVAVETLASVARTESRFEAFAIHDNVSGRTFKPASRDDAIAIATELVVGDQHSVDLGIMQINSANFPRLALTITDAFDPCRSMAAAERVLVAGYVAPASGTDQQPALNQTLSRYNTGDPARGLTNGYVQRVQASAEVVVPAIHVQGNQATDGTPGLLGQDAPVLAQPLPPPPPSWDVYGQARAARSQGGNIATVQVRPLPLASMAIGQTVGAAPTSAPVQLGRVANREAVTDAR